MDSPHRNLASALRQLCDDKKADAALDSIPVVASLDEWVLQHAPGMIAELEAETGIPHWTTRERNKRRLVSSGLRQGYPA